MDPLGRRQRGRPKRIFIDMVREDMQIIYVTKEYVEDRERQGMMICCGDSYKKLGEAKKKEFSFF